jgi:predicted nucleic acid-binding protein
MPAQRRTFHDPLESVIYWDSSFAIARLHGDHDHHAECVDFACRLDTEGILSIASDFVHNELAFHTIKAALVVEARRIGQYWRDVYRQRPDLVIATMPQVQANRAELNRMTLFLPIPEAVQDRAFQLIEAYALLPTDAYHVAIAMDAGVNACVSLDEASCAWTA